MKLFKKLLSYIIAFTMVLSLATLLGGNVHAATGNYKITLEDNAETKTKTTDHTYHAYQIFSGDLKVNEDKDKTKVLSNIQWGTGIDSSKKDALISALKSDDTFKGKFGNVTDAASVAKALEGIASNSTEMDAFAQVVGQYLSGTSQSSSVNDNKTEITGLAAGYYLVKDTLDTDDKGKVKNENDAYTKFIVDVVGDTTAKIKSDVPTVVKKVQDTNDSKANSTTGWQDSADYDIGDEVPYQITGTMPNNIDAYTTYKYEFTDTMSKGLTYTAKTATIKIGETTVTDSFTEKVEAVKDQNNKETGETKVTWTCDNLKGISGVTLDKDTKVVVAYSAKLNEDAVIGAAGNPNKVDLTYSNNPNNSGKGETGKTPEDTNIVFTYAAKFNKVDGSNGNKPLSGAEFTLNKWNGSEFVAIKKTEKTATVENGTKFTFKGLDDGIYQLVESTTPAGYNTMKPLEFEIYATHTNDGEENPLTLTNLTMKKMENLEKTKDQTLINDVEGEKSDGIMTTDVVNKKGSTLPSTGGMGTTLLYVAGGILVACAAAYVVLNKKRA